MKSLFLKINEWEKTQNTDFPFIINNLDLGSWIALNNLPEGIYAKKDNQKIVIILENEDQNKLEDSFPKNLKIQKFFYPKHGPYESVIDLDDEANGFLESIDTIYNLDFDVLCTDLKSLSWLIPERASFSREEILLLKDEVEDPIELKIKLNKIGYVEALQAAHPGTYAHRGEIFDIHLINGKAVRIQYFDEIIEAMHPIDIETFKSDRTKEIEKLEVGASSSSLFGPKNIQNLRENIPTPGLKFKDKLLERQSFFKKISNQDFFDSSLYFLPFLFEKRNTLFNFLKDNSLFVFENYEQAYLQYEQFFDECNEAFEETINDERSTNLLPEVKNIFNKEVPKNLKKIIINKLNINAFKENEISKNTIDFKFESLEDFSRYKKSLSQNPELKNKTKRIDYFLKFLETGDHFIENFLCFYKDQSSLEKLKLIFEPYNFKENLNYIHGNLKKGFYYANDNVMVLSDQDFFQLIPRKKSKTKKKKYDLFAEQIATLQKGDYVMHKSYGIGKYLGFQNLNVGGDNSDFVLIQFKDDDKVYVPVHNLDLVQKHADSNTECKLADLKSKKFLLARSKAKSSVKELAFDLLKLQAERETFKGFAYSSPGEDYEEFSRNFKYQLTPDQDQAVVDILSDLQEVRPMDRLVCGDVGFGKTEVAMRAAFKAVEDGRQVAVLVPTTILCLQHFMNFKERFKNFPVNIEFLSRLKTTKQSNEVFKKINEGQVDIIIGTHKILSEKLKFNKLGIVIIDEEHRFGVSHKEKLKVLKSSVDFLTLTATPIPRTLQMSFLGIKELSLIQTPPPRRQSINTYIIREDKHTIKTAIETELKRGGQVFFIHNKVSDIEIIVSKIQEMVPKAKIVFAHGQLGEKDLEKRIYDFYNKEYDILVSTTIVESGIDIPTANTMIINNAQNFGLAQLHQLRGRIGRANRKAYCYFVIPKYRNLSETAEKRLEALQKYADLGSGFAIANSDLDIRGAGNVLGAQQSGHIHSIGLELYLELLQEAIAEIKGEVNQIKKSDTDVSTFFNAFIPDSYIPDQQTRLKYYKKISNLENSEQANEIEEELENIYGEIPEFTLNLITLIKIKKLCNNLGIRQARFKEKLTHLFFDENYLERHPDYRTKVINYFMNKRGPYKLEPNSSVKIKIHNKSPSDCLKILADITKTMV